MKTLTVENSSSVTNVTHDGDVLDVTYTSGRTYRYNGVPESVFDQIEAEQGNGASVGQMVNMLVKSQGYEYEEVTA